MSSIRSVPPRTGRILFLVAIVMMAAPLLLSGAPQVADEEQTLLDEEQQTMLEEAESMIGGEDSVPGQVVTKEFPCQPGKVEAQLTVTQTQVNFYPRDCVCGDSPEWLRGLLSRDEQIPRRELDAWAAGAAFYDMALRPGEAQESTLYCYPLEFVFALLGEPTAVGPDDLDPQD